MNDREKRLEVRLEVATELPSPANNPYITTAERSAWRCGWLDCQVAAREAIADDDAGSVTTTDAPHSIGYVGNDIPPQHQEALEALDEIEREWMTVFDGHEEVGGTPEEAKPLFTCVRRHLTAPPTVPEDDDSAPIDTNSLYALVNEMSERGCEMLEDEEETAISLARRDTWYAAAHMVMQLADEQRALAQHSEPGQIYRIAHELANRVDELLGIMDDPDAMAYDGATTRSAARNTLHEYRKLAAPALTPSGRNDMNDREKRLERALRGLMERGDFWIAVAQAKIAFPGEVDDCMEALTDDGAVRAAYDAATYGTGFAKDGQRIDPREVYQEPPQHRDAGDALREILSDEDAMLGVADRAAKRQEEMMGGRREALEALEQCVFDAWQEGFNAEHVSDLDFSEAVARASELKDQIPINPAPPTVPEDNDE